MYNKDFSVRDLILFLLIDCDVGEAKYIAIDKNNAIMGYYFKPILYDGEWGYDSINDNELDTMSVRSYFIDIGIETVDYKKYGFDWRESLVKL